MKKRIDYASMFTLRSDGRYQGYWRELIDGEPKGKRHTICDRDPEKLYRRIQEKESTEKPVPTFREIAERWHEKHWAKIREGTKACYDAPYRRAVERLGDRPAETITAFDIKVHLEKLRNEGYGIKSIKTQRTIYRLIFEAAINAEDTGKILRANPAKETALPSGIKKPEERNAPEDATVNAIRSQWKHHKI